MKGELPNKETINFWSGVVALVVISIIVICYVY